ncbi:MAG: hypothetical protein MN733_02220, partial [Nitrososphaera sp.]|nr:hypothetical protein [Nitrososphaera sp.]
SGTMLGRGEEVIGGRGEGVIVAVVRALGAQATRKRKVSSRRQIRITVLFVVEHGSAVLRTYKMDSIVSVEGN